MTPGQILTCRYVERALRKARKEGLKLFAYTDVGLFLSETSVAVPAHCYQENAKNAMELRHWQETAFKLPAGILADAGAGY